MYKYGLKLWSVNTDNYITEAQNLYDNGLYDYIELYAVPDTLDTLKKWKELKIPFIVHAPHFAHGMNLSKNDYLSNNLKLAEETKRFADELNSKYIIFHGGIDGNIEETTKQLKKINDNRILIENKPYTAIPKMGGTFCVGSTIEEMKYVLKNIDCGFCLDIGHCICAANSAKIDPMKYIKEFMELKPSIFHLTDGDYNSEKDRHDHFGKGNYNLQKILDIIPNNALTTIETYKDFKDSLADFKEDIIFLKKMLNSR